MGFNPFARHAENQPSKLNDQGKSASTLEPQTATARDAETEERPPARPDENKRAPYRAFDPFAGHGKKQFRLVRKD
jgi:hypothetical protein